MTDLSNKDVAGILQALSNISQQVESINSRIDALTRSRELAVTEEQDSHRLDFSFDPLNGAPRRPGKHTSHRIGVAGTLAPSQALTLGRTAALFALLIDYHRRCSGAPPLDDGVLGLAILILGRLLGTSSQPDTAEQSMRAVFRRMQTTLPELPAPGGGCYVLHIGPYPYSLEVRYASSASASSRVLSSRGLTISLTTSDSELKSVLEEFSPTRMLDSIRQTGAAYIAGGPEAFDTLFLEFFDHELDVEEVSMFFKPSITTYPMSLLNFMHASEQDIRRKRVLHSGLTSGRISFREILNTETIAEMITADKDGKMSLYGPSVTRQHVLDHLEHIAWMLNELESYELVLTERPLPFLFSTFRIGDSKTRECYTTFFRQLIREHDPDVECFAIYGSQVASSIEHRVLPPVLNAPQTITSRAMVRTLILNAWKRLDQLGPLSRSEAEGWLCQQQI